MCEMLTLGYFCMKTFFVICFLLLVPSVTDPDPVGSGPGRLAPDPDQDPGLWCRKAIKP
jgi:hypothetical protein